MFFLYLKSILIKKNSNIIIYLSISLFSFHQICSRYMLLLTTVKLHRVFPSSIRQTASARLIQFHWASCRDSEAIVKLLISRPHLMANLLRYLRILMVKTAINQTLDQSLLNDLSYVNDIGQASFIILPY